MAGVMAAALAASLLFAPVGAGLVRQWYEDPASSHGLVLLIAAGWLVRQRWTALRDLPMRPSTLGLVALAFSLLLHVAGALAGELFILRISSVASLAAAVAALSGLAHLRALATPVALLFLAIPLPATVVTSLTLPLQLTASHVAAGLLNAGGIAAARDGNILTLSAVTLEVAEACSGLRSIVSLASLIAVAKAVGVVPTRHALLLAAATVPIAIAGNSLRVTLTGVLAHVVGPWTARGVVHDATGYAAFAGMCLALALIHRLVLARRRAGAPPSGACDSPALAW